MKEHEAIASGSSLRRNRERGRVGALLVGAALLAGCLTVLPAQAVVERCSASGPVVAGWGGSRYLPVAPQGVGPSCNLVLQESISYDYNAVRLTIHAVGEVGGQIIEPNSGRRYFCRGALESQLGQDRHAYPVNCKSISGGLQMIVRVQSGSRELLNWYSTRFYCSTTGEVGVLANIVCQAVVV